MGDRDIGGEIDDRKLAQVAEDTGETTLNILDLHFGDGRGGEGRERFQVGERPGGSPTVGAGTIYSDIIRDGREDEVPFYLGPSIRRGDAFAPPEGKAVPPSAVPGPRVRMDSVGASPEFQTQMRDEMDKLPENLRQLLSDKQIRITLTDSMTEAAPDLKGVKPRGWPDGTTFANGDGAFRPDYRQVIVAEKFKDSKGNELKSDRGIGVLHHEVGHAVDAALDNYSQTDEFKEAYKKDIDKMPSDVRNRLEYLLQPDGVGTQETFAEVFAALQGSSANAHQTQLILANFPEVAALLKKKLASV